MRRLVSVWLTDWPVTVWSRTAGRTPPPDGAPFALVERTARGLVIHALNPAARALGLWRGQAHADACTIAPGLISAPAEPDRDQAALVRLALWAERFSPAVAADAAVAGGEGLIIDMTGGAHLFGGETQMLADLAERLGKAGISARCAMADTAGAAWAMARHAGKAQVVVAPGGTKEALAPLSVEALRLDLMAVKLLARLGLTRIGDLYALPRSGLARRFRAEKGGLGLAVVARLDQALGVSPEPLVIERAAPRYRAWQVFAEPLIDSEGVGHRLPELAERLCGQLERDGQGARHIRLTAFRVDGATTSLEAGLSAPAARTGHLIRLLREKGLERLDLGFGADALMLSAVKAEPLILRQGEIEAERDAAPGDALAALIDRLQARLGDTAVRTPAPRQSWIPEQAEAWVQAMVGRAQESLACDRPRPILLFDPPEPVETIAEMPDGVPARFVWRRVPRRIVKAAGPERLSPEWWRRSPNRNLVRSRDYYRVEDEAGRRYWLFRDGLYGREDADAKPTWWLHGVFA